MLFLETIYQSIMIFFPTIEAFFIIGLALWGANWVLIGRHSGLGNERLFSRQIAMMGLTIVGMIAIALSLPVSESSRNQIIALIGLAISGIFAFSSGTIFTNLIAGIMLRITKPFRTGDFININKEYFGRVVERGLLDTEIQTESRELIAIPNIYMTANPISVVRSSGTIVSTTLSLGYDIHHRTAESLLLRAAKKCGLEEPFVHVQQLGSYSITYKVSGMLTDVKSLLTTRSNLCRYILDVLHENRVEIMSPAFMNQRQLPVDKKIIPLTGDQEFSENVAVAEEVVFDKAETAEQLEKEKQQLLDKIQQCQSQSEGASEDDKKQNQKIIDQCRKQLSLIENDKESAEDKSS